LDKIKGVSIGLGLSLLLCSPLFASINVMLAAHETDSARIEALERNLPFLEAKVASTLRDGASTPVSFDGILQLRSQFHSYCNLADSSWLYLTRQGFTLNQDQPFLRLGMTVSPGRNTILWSTIGLNASFPGYNTHHFLTNESGWHYDFQHHSSGSAGRGVIAYEDLNAGFAIRSRAASFMLKMGSMNWTEASPLSIWAGSKKAFAWERFAYELEQPISSYFNYKLASSEQVGRGFWNKQPFQGIDFSVIDLPGGLRGFFLYGVGNPFDKNQRYHMDMSMDLGYAADGDNQPSVVMSGIGDSYRKFLFYRLSKQIKNKDITFGINNGFTRSNPDVAFASYEWGALFNQRFDIGRYGSEWNYDGSKIILKNSEDLRLLDSMYNNRGTYRRDNLSIISLGEGFLIEPNVLSIDGRGSIGRNFRFGFDVGASWLDTHFIRIDPLSYGPANNDPSADLYNSVVGPTTHPGTQYNTGHILDQRTVTSAPAFATYGSLSYDFKRINSSLEMFWGGENYYAPHSMISTSDAFFPFGSNMLGSSTFLNASGAEYMKNSRALKLMLEPKTPSWHGYLKFGYGLVSQNNKSRDIIALPYRLNGATLQHTTNHWYSRWGSGTVTETNAFTAHQNGFNPNTVNNAPQTLAKHRQNRFGDQSFIAPSAPHIGGLRLDFDGASEIFVPFKTAEQAIFNYFSGSTVVGTKRDLQNIWHSAGAYGNSYSYTVDEHAFLNPNTSGKSQFSNMINYINTLNGGFGVRVNGTQFYSIDTESISPDGKSAYVIIKDTNGTEITREYTAITSESGFVPENIKKSFDFNVDWAMNIAKYVGYRNDLFLSLYYQLNGVTRKFQPLAFQSDADSDVLLVSHYLRTEPTIGITRRFYITTLFGFERWLSGHTWVGEFEGVANNSGLPNFQTSDNGAAGGYKLTGIRQSELETTDLAWGVGFDWDMMKRVSLHGRYKWLRHSDKNLPFNDFTGNVVSLELKAFF